MDILGKKNVPDVELSDDDLNALGGLSKTTASGLSYNPYQKIDPKFLELNKFDEEDDDDWLYTTVSHKITHTECVLRRRDSMISAFRVGPVPSRRGLCDIDGL